MPQVNTDHLQFWCRQCDVVLVVESDLDAPHSLGVKYELDELRRVRNEPSGLPAAIVVGTSFAPRHSDKLHGLSRFFLPLSSPDDPQVYSLVAVPWLVSRLQRSGSVGLEILDHAKEKCALVDRFTWFGPFWRGLNISRIPWKSPVHSWWPCAARLHAFMTKESTGEFGAAWRVLAKITESRVKRKTTAARRLRPRKK